MKLWSVYRMEFYSVVKIKIEVIICDEWDWEKNQTA